MTQLQMPLDCEAKTQGREKAGDTAPGKGKKECKGQKSHTGCVLRQEPTEWEQQSDRKSAPRGWSEVLMSRESRAGWVGLCLSVGGGRPCSRLRLLRWVHGKS